MGTLVQFETYGLISMLLNDSNGSELKFADGETGTLIFKKISFSEKPDTLPLNGNMTIKPPTKQSN